MNSFSGQPNYLQGYKHFLLTSDKIIRSSLVEILDRECNNKPNTKVIEELGITHGAARVDIAVVNGIIHGYELKSDKDTLKRLPDQIRIYNNVLDKVTLVVGKNHLHEAINIIPDWWGVTIAKATDSSDIVEFCNIRDPEQNPSQDNAAIAALLWREEALGILEKIGQASGMRSKTRSVIYQHLAESLDSEVLKDQVREHLRTRISWRSGAQCMLNGG